MVKYAQGIRRVGTERVNIVLARRRGLFLLFLKLLHHDITMFPSHKLHRILSQGLCLMLLRFVKICLIHGHQ